MNAPLWCLVSVHLCDVLIFCNVWGLQENIPNLYRLNYYLPGWTNMKTFHDGRSWAAHFLIATFKFEATWRRPSCRFRRRPTSGPVILGTLIRKPEVQQLTPPGVCWPSHATIVIITCHSSPPTSPTRDARGTAVRRCSSRTLTFLQMCLLSLNCSDDYSCQINASFQVLEVGHIYRGPNLSVLFFLVPGLYAKLTLQPTTPSYACKERLTFWTCLLCTLQTFIGDTHIRAHTHTHTHAHSTQINTFEVLKFVGKL